MMSFNQVKYMNKDNIIGLVVLCFSVAAGYFFVRATFFTQGGPLYFSTSPTPYSTPFVNLDTSGWRTYRNEQYGFEVSYPTDWELQADLNYSGFQMLARYENTDSWGIVDPPWPGLKVGLKKDDFATWSNFIVTSQLTFTEASVFRGVARILFQFGDKNVFAECGFYSQREILKNCNQILSTFRFLNP